MSRTLFWATALLSAANAATIRVKSPQTIQAALDSAQSGDLIIVEPGTYAERVLITKPHIELVGKKGAIIVPPTPYPTTPNGCTGLAGNDTMGAPTQAGICILGQGVQFATFVKEHAKVTNVSTPVEGVRVKGFEVRNFGLNIAIVGAKDAEVRENTVTDGGAYGILTVGSHGSLVTRNTVNSSDLKFIGICNDDRSDVTITQNVISEYGIALCIQTNKADVGHNKVTNCCVGAFVDPGVDGARVTHNKIGPSNPLCVIPEAGGFAGGIVLGGATNTLVRNNQVNGTNDGNNPLFPTNVGAGVLIYDDPGTGIVATGNTVTFNTLSSNEQDVLVLSAGANKVKHNTCTTPAEICNNQ